MQPELMKLYLMVIMVTGMLFMCHMDVGFSLNSGLFQATKGCQTWFTPHLPCLTILLEKVANHRWGLYHTDWTVNAKKISQKNEGQNVCRLWKHPVNLLLSLTNQIRNANSGCLSWAANKLIFNQRVSSWAEITDVLSNGCQLFC